MTEFCHIADRNILSANQLNWAEKQNAFPCFFYVCNNPLGIKEADSLLNLPMHREAVYQV
jgi:hypothetical protein